MLVSIITAVFNRAATVCEAAQSLAAQHRARTEWVVIDGASTDNTLARIRDSARAPDVLISEPDEGIYDALNKGLDHAHGDVIGFLHSDDFYPSCGVLARVSDAFGDPAVEAVYGDLEYVRMDDPDIVVRYWRGGEYSRMRLKQGWMPPHPTFFMRRHLYQSFGGFNKKYRIAADYDSLVRYLWVHGVRARYLPGVLMRMRTGGTSNRNLSAVFRKSYEDLVIASSHGLGVGSVVWKNISKLPQFWTVRRDSQAGNG